MREHEVPTHVQAEDKVLLWFSFPQIVAITAVCALSYGAYRYAPVGPSEARIALAVLFGLTGIAAVVGKIGGRRLPLVAADLLKYRLGAGLYIGTVSQLVRDEPPAPVQPVRSRAESLRLMARRSRLALRRLQRKMRGQRGRRNGRMVLRPRDLFGKLRSRNSTGSKLGGGRDASARNGKKKRRRFWRSFLGAAVVAVLAATASQSAATVVLADGHEEIERWRDEIDFELTDPVPGRRVFVERLSVTGDRAEVTLAAATDLDIRVRAFGGPDGDWLRFWGSARLAEGERIDYSLPLHGPVPSFTFSWEDGLEQAGALTITHEKIPHSLPAAENELCNVRLTSLAWSPGEVSGVIDSECSVLVVETVEFQTVAGHVEVAEMALMDAEVTEVIGTVSASSGGSRVSVPFVPDDSTRFSLPVGDGEAVHDVSVDVTLQATLSIAVPPLTTLTHVPERTEYRTETVSLLRRGTSRTVSETVTVTHDDGSTTQHVISAVLSIPSKTVRKDVTLTIVHPERVESETLEREPFAKVREERLSMSSAVGSDDPFAVLVLPEPEPEEPPAEQTPAGDLRSWFDQLGWDWPW